MISPCEVWLTTHGEILNIPDQSTPEDIRNALVKQQRAVAIFRQLEQTTIGPLREQTLRNLMAALLAMADTLERRLREALCPTRDLWCSLATPFTFR